MLYELFIFQIKLAGIPFLLGLTQWQTKWLKNMKWAKLIYYEGLWKFLKFENSELKKKRSIIIVFYKLMLRLHTVWELDNIILHFYNL